MPRFKDLAICVRHMDWSETSQVVTLLTEQHGLIRGLAKGSRRMSPSAVARFSGGIELLTLGQALGSLRTAYELAGITEWDLQESYPQLRTNLHAQQIALYAADVTAAMIADHDPHPKTFAGLRALLAELGDRKPTSAPAAALGRFQWQILEDCGYQPQLDVDIKTSQPLAEAGSYWFDPRAGGFTAVGEESSGSGMDGPGPWRVRKETLESLRLVARSAETGAAAASASDSVSRVNRLLCVFVRAILDRELPTMAFILSSE
ncbi:MAG: DNA repair protein RecO [Phycisphaeraceae bacterium]|nr:DNA repair protein RecO [Phycisphaeraceae bacterium]